METSPERPTSARAMKKLHLRSREASRRSKILGPSVSERVSYGYDAAAGDYPYMAALDILRYDGLSSYCGATLINDRVLLTAAHCVVDHNKTTGQVTRYTPSMITAKIGITKRSSNTAIAKLQVGLHIYTLRNVSSLRSKDCVCICSKRI